MIFGRNVQTRIDLIHDRVQQRVAHNQERYARDALPVMREFDHGQRVWFRRFPAVTNQPVWVPGCVLERVDPGDLPYQG